MAEKDIDHMIQVIKKHGLRDELIFSVMRKVPREYFVDPEFAEDAYSDKPIPIGHEQTISQPFTVAFMLHHLELREGHSVLEIGAGSGWSSSLLSVLVDPGKVEAYEIIPELVDLAKKNIERLRKKTQVFVNNLELHTGDGTNIAFDRKFDRIIIHAATPRIKQEFFDHLNLRGILIAPVGDQSGQRMMKFAKYPEGVKDCSLGDFSFVPLKGKHGF